MKGGYSAGIADHPAVTAMSNHSLGASTSVVLPRVLRQADFSGFDFVVLDFALNEEVWTVVGAGTVEQIEERILDFIASLPENGPRPVIAILPSLVSFREHMPVRDMYRRIAMENGYPFVDAYDFLEAKGLALALTPDGPFQDVDHMLAPVAHEFGHMIVDRLLAEPPAVQGSTTRLLPSHDHLVVADAIRNGAELLIRSTSLLSVEVAQMRGTGSVTFEFADQAELVGIGTNGACSNAIMQVESEQGNLRIRTAGSQFRPGRSDLVYIVTPCQVLPGLRYTFSIAPKQDAEVVTELGGISVRGAPRERMYRTYAKADAPASESVIP